MKKIWIDNAGWMLAAVAAVSLAFASPTESSVMGRLPPIVAHKADRNTVALPAELPAERTLVLLTFRSEQRSDAEAWIDGLQLRDSPALRFVRMPVVHDAGDTRLRSEKEERLFGYYSSNPDRSALMAVFTDRDAFLRQAGIVSKDHVYAMVLNREGEVLARAEGPFDAQRAEALRETLLGEPEF
jgi:hypothetical protein